MSPWPVHAHCTGPIVMIGFGSIGKGTLPLLERHIGFDKSRMVVIAPDDAGREILDARGIAFRHEALTIENYIDVLKPLLAQGPGQAFLVNLSVEVSSVALVRLCKEVGALYIDTCVEPWPGFYTDTRLTVSQRSNYALRESMLDVARAHPGGPTAVTTCGANPGMVSWFVKQALINLAADMGHGHAEPASREDWATLAQQLGV